MQFLVDILLESIKVVTVNRFFSRGIKITS